MTCEAMDQKQYFGNRGNNAIDSNNYSISSTFIKTRKKKWEVFNKKVINFGSFVGF